MGIRPSAFFLTIPSPLQWGHSNDLSLLLGLIDERQISTARSHNALPQVPDACQPRAAAIEPSSAEVYGEPTGNSRGILGNTIGFMQLPLPRAAPRTARSAALLSISMRPSSRYRWRRAVDVGSSIAAIERPDGGVGASYWRAVPEAPPVQARRARCRLQFCGAIPRPAMPRVARAGPLARSQFAKMPRATPARFPRGR